MRVHWKIRFLRGGGSQKTVYRGELPKNGKLSLLADLRGERGLAKEEVVVFLRGG